MPFGVLEIGTVPTLGVSIAGIGFLLAGFLYDDKKANNAYEIKKYESIKQMLLGTGFIAVFPLIAILDLPVEKLSGIIGFIFCIIGLVIFIIGFVSNKKNEANKIAEKTEGKSEEPTNTETN